MPSYKHYLNGLVCFSFALSASIDATTYTVTNAAMMAGDNAVTPVLNSLRALILTANDTPPAAGTAHQIVFASGLSTTSITLAAPLPPIGPNVNLIDTNGQTITLDGSMASNNSGLYFLPGNSGVTIQNTGGSGASFIASSTKSLGGSGGNGPGGGGALGAGGCIDSGHR